MRVQKQSKEAKQVAAAQDFSGFVTVTELSERMTNQRQVLEENAKRLHDLERTLYTPAAPGLAWPGATFPQLPNQRMSIFPGQIDISSSGQIVSSPWRIDTSPW